MTAPLSALTSEEIAELRDAVEGLRVAVLPVSVLERLLLSAERAEAAEGMLERLLDLVPYAPCPCQGLYPYAPGNVNDHHPSCAAEAARAALAAWRSRGGGT